MLTLKQLSEILIQKYEKSLALGLGLDKKVLVLTTKSYLHHCGWG